MVEWLSQIDTQLFLFLNGLHHPLLDSVMVVFSGKLSWIPVYVFFLYLIIKYYRWQSIMVLLFVVLADQCFRSGFGKSIQTCF